MRTAISELSRSTRRQRAVPLRVAVGASALAVATGNGIVAVSQSIGGAGGEAFTFVAVLSAAGAATGAMRRWFSRADLGLVRPTGPDRRVGRLTKVAVVVLGASIAVAALRSTESTDWEVAAPIVLMGRVVLGTALGEELIHRGALLTLWAATGVGPRVVLGANAVTFGLWHVAAATQHGAAWPVHIVVPALGGLLFCWGRVRTGSIVTPWLFHAAINAPGTA